MLYGYPPSNGGSVAAAKKPKTEKGFRFPGILKFLDRNFQESNSDSYREWMTQYMSATRCTVCNGKRLRPESLAVKLAGHSIAEFTALSLKAARPAVANILSEITQRQQAVAGRPRKKLPSGSIFFSPSVSATLASTGLPRHCRAARRSVFASPRKLARVCAECCMCSMSRPLDCMRGTTTGCLDRLSSYAISATRCWSSSMTKTRSGGRISSSISAPAQAKRAATSLRRANLSRWPRLRNHSRDNISAARQALRFRRSGAARTANRFRFLAPHENNLKDVDFTLPLGLLTVVTGVSGSGKSTLVNDIFYRALAQKLYRSMDPPGAHKSVAGIEHIDKVIEIDQAPIGRTPRSNPATYTGVFAPIRELFAMLPESRERGYKPGRFSFNVKGGRCEACQGDGLRRIEMNFLPDVYVMCEICRGKRYNSETLAVRFKGHSISDVLTCRRNEALKLAREYSAGSAKTATLVEVGLGYVQLGQSATTLSGGEAQRIKLARELSKRQTGRTLYILDEPTTGLHFDDVRKLLDVLQRLVSLGNTVLIIEHHLDVIKQADWVIDLGPEGGDGGGRIVAQGSPEQVARNKKSYTGQALARVLHLNGANGYGSNGQSSSK